MPSNIERLGQTLHGQMRSVSASRAETSAELGKINNNHALIPDESPGPIPKGEYSICDGAGKGSRVLIIWCGTEAVVVDSVKEG